MRTYKRVFILLAVMMAAEVAFAQTQTPQIGLPPFGSFQQTEFDRIDATRTFTSKFQLLEERAEAWIFGRP